MPPKASSRASSAQPKKTAPAKPTANGTARSRATKSKTPAVESKKEAIDTKKSTQGRAKKSQTPTVNGTATKTAAESKTTARDRSKKTATPAAESKPAPKASRKRKADEEAEEAEPENEEAPAVKKAKTKETEAEAKAKPVKAAKPKAAKAPAVPKADLPKGPRRVRGKKTEINALRYTEPLKVFVFGEGSSGELGLGATRKAIDVKRPRFNEALTNMDVVKIATGGMHVVALTKDNKILTWGVNDNAALGRDTSGGNVKMRDADAEEDSDSEDESGGLNDLEATPTAISNEHFPEDTVFVDVAAGDSCSFALTTEGAVYGWGTFRKNEGILGFGRDIHTAKTPVYIDGVTKVTQIACGTNHVVVLDKDHRVYAWGNGQQNQLGRRVTERTLIESLQPNRIGFHDSSVKRPSQKIAKIACGDYHGLAIAEDGHVWSWGANNYCETGHPEDAGEDNASVLTPRIIHSLEGKDIVTVEGGSHHNIALTKGGDVLVWGRCDGSQTGIPASELNAIDDDEKVLKSNDKAKILLAPTPVPGLSDVVTGAVGPEHTIVINKDGKAYSWGFSANYQTGQGTDEDVDTPTLMDNTAVRDVKLIWAGAGGQYSIVASKK